MSQRAKVVGMPVLAALPGRVSVAGMPAAGP